MNIFEAAVYGAIQGLSEFLPISSSGHLALLPHVMKIEDPGVVFDLMMHLGTALAVFTYFRRDIFRYGKTFTPALANFKIEGEDRWFVRNFIFSTFVSVIFIVLLIPVAERARDPFVIILNLSFFGALLWFADWKNNKNQKLLNSPMTSGLQWKVAGLIGLAQALAIFPGVSRSGITLTAALLVGMRRRDAGNYSFLLSLPIILAGILKEIPDLMKNSNSSSFMTLVTGVVVSFLIGWLTIHFFMKLISRIQLKYFTFYRWLIALVMLVLLA
jgi:undecaprenyl-diphosphatase